MTRILSLIGVVLVMGCGPEPRDVRTLQEVDGVLMNPSDGQPYSGPVFGFTDGPVFGFMGELGWMTGSLKDGEMDGPVEIYHNENGPLRMKGTMKDGVPDGLIETYHENGQLSGTGTFKDGVQVGPYEFYYENGLLWEKGTWKDNEKCGEWLEEGETVTYDPC